MNLRKPVLVLLLIIVCPISYALEQAGGPDSKGMLVLYNDALLAEANKIGFAHLSSAGCSVIRRGNIDVRNVATDIAGRNTSKLNRVAFLQCNTMILANENSRRILLDNFTAHGNGIVVQGDFDYWDQQHEALNKEDERAYVIKLSYFNNLTSTRESEEDAVDGLALTRSEGWKREAKIFTTQAIGIPTPDAVGILYFASVANRTHFRDTNPDILEKIGNFNKTHLAEFEYIYATSVRRVN